MSKGRDWTIYQREDGTRVNASRGLKVRLAVEGTRCVG